MARTPPGAYTPATNNVTLPSTLRALGHRNYRLFFFGQLISVVGTWMQSVALSWLVYRLTGSPARLGLVSFAGQIPVFLIAPFGGLLADRYSRRTLLVATQSAAMVLALALAALTLTGWVHLWHVFVLAMLLGCVNGFDIPARQSFVVEMVGKEDLLNAIALNSSVFNGARIVGPAVAGVLVSLIGEGWCFFSNGVSFIAVIAGLLWMRLPPFSSPVHDSRGLRRIAEGFSFVARTPPVRALLLVVALTSFVGMPYAVLMPIVADQVLHGGARGLGILMGATGIGAFLGAIALASRRGLRGLGAWIAAAGTAFGLSLVAFSWSRSFWLSAALLVPVGFSMIVQISSVNTLLQSLTPDALRGRVMAVYSMAFMGVAPAGALIAGLVADRVGVTTTIGAGGLICIGGAAVFARKLGPLRQQARAIILAQNDRTIPSRP